MQAYNKVVTTKYWVLVQREKKLYINDKSNKLKRNIVKNKCHNFYFGPHPVMVFGKDSEHKIQ